MPDVFISAAENGLVCAGGLSHNEMRDCMPASVVTTTECLDEIIDCSVDIGLWLGMAP